MAFSIQIPIRTLLLRSTLPDATAAHPIVYPATHCQVHSRLSKHPTTDRREATSRIVYHRIEELVFRILRQTKPFLQVVALATERKKSRALSRPLHNHVRGLWI